MQITRLELAQVRVFEQATFEFKPGMNLLVGINGAGKSTVLDVLRIQLAQTLPKFTAARTTPFGFSTDDIRVGRTALTAELEFDFDGIEYSYLVHSPRESVSRDTKAPIIDDRFSHQVDRKTRIDRRRQQLELYASVDVKEFFPAVETVSRNVKKAKQQPIAVFYSPHRALVSDARSGKNVKAANEQSSAFADAFNPMRRLQLRELAEWWLVQQALAKESNDARFGRNLEVFSETVTRFLDGCSNLRAIAGPKTTLLIDKADGSLDVSQLSDGERSMIALVLDLAKRLAQVNPELDDPIHDGQAVVLIDELDLHLHPGWQRTIVEKLTTTFRNCQFIATTHSPQIIGEVRQDRIQIIADGQVYSPTYSFGVDSSRILEEILDVPARTHNVDALLGRISRAIGDEQVSAAKQMLTELTAIVGENDADVIRVRTLIEFMEDEE